MVRQSAHAAADRRHHDDGEPDHRVEPARADRARRPGRRAASAVPHRRRPAGPAPDRVRESAPVRCPGLTRAQDASGRPARRPADRAVATTPTLSSSAPSGPSSSNRTGGRNTWSSRCSSSPKPTAGWGTRPSDSLDLAGEIAARSPAATGSPVVTLTCGWSRRPTRVPVRPFSGEPTLVRQAFVNLVTNAVEYNVPTASSRSTDAGGFVVENSGPLVPETRTAACRALPTVPRGARHRPAQRARAVDRRLDRARARLAPEVDCPRDGGPGRIDVSQM